MIQAVMFDLDGTLTNTLQDIATAMNRALRLNDLPEFPTEAYRYLVGDGVMKLAERAVRDVQEKRAQVQHDYQLYYQEHTRDTTRPYAGIPELLHALDARGLRLCVLSNKPDADTKNVIHHFFPDVPFALVRGQLPGVPVKPNPAAALSMAQEMNIAPKDFFYLGDTSVDMHCATRAGMHPVGVLWGFREARELHKAGAEHLIARPEELLHLV